MGELASALDALAGLAADDLHDSCDADVLARTRALVTARNMLDAELARTVRHADTTQAPEHDGLKSMRSWLRTHARLSGAAIGALITAGRVQQALPAVAAAAAAGQVTADQIGVLAPITTPAALEKAAAAGVDLAAVQTALLAVATRSPHRALQQAVGAYLAALDPDGPEPDPTEGRSLTQVQHPDGRWTGRYDLDEVGGEKVATALEAIAAKSRCAGDLRTRDQLLGDALVQLADLALASGSLPILRTVKPHVIVQIGIEDLMDPATGHGAGRTGFGAEISAARARWLACDGSVTRLIMGPEGQPLDLGRTQRVFPAHIRRSLEARDKGCVFAGCHAPTHWCDAHHLLEWVLDDGPTSVDNGALLCERHHTKAHHGFTVDRTPDGRWHTYRPDGTEILLAPPLRC